MSIFSKKQIVLIPLTVSLVALLFIPVGLYAQTDPVVRVLIHLQWDAVEKNTDGTDITDLQFYQICHKLPADAEYVRCTNTPDAATTVLTVPNLLPGISYNFIGRAIDNAGNSSVDSAVLVATTAAEVPADTVAPEPITGLCVIKQTLILQSGAQLDLHYACTETP